MVELLALAAASQALDKIVASVQTAVKRMNELFASARETLKRYCSSEQQRLSKEGGEREEALINAAHSGIQQGRKAGR